MPFHWSKCQWDQPAVTSGPAVSRAADLSKWQANWHRFGAVTAEGVDTLGAEPEASRMGFESGS
jgi:hypothetical protein